MRGSIMESWLLGAAAVLGVVLLLARWLLRARRHRLEPSVQLPSAGAAAIPAAAFGRFRIVGPRQSAGAMSWQLDATDPDSGSPLLIKWVRKPGQPGAGPAGDALVRLRALENEAATLSVVQGPGIAALVARGSDENMAWMALARIPGCDLERRVQEGGPIEARDVQHLAQALAQALARVHQAGYTHGDIKPANIMIDAEANGAVLIDFGMARQIGAEPFDARAFAGSPAYLAPEIVTRVAEAATPATDWYALGASLWFAATGRPPRTGESLAALLHSIANDPLPDLTALAPALDASLGNALVAWLDRDPQVRCSAADSFLRTTMIAAKA